MSIPPLVCSTPPPPEQCVDDKDPEDFDVRYNLSQDEDENSDYDFGGFSNYNHYQSSLSENKQSKQSKLPIESKVIQNNTENKCDKNEIEQINNLALETNKSSESKKIEEEINIEDLNLRVDENPMPNSKYNQVENQTALEESDESISEKHSKAVDEQENSSSTDEYNEKSVYNEESTHIQETFSNLEESILVDKESILEELPNDLTGFVQSVYREELNDDSSEIKHDEFTDFDDFNLKSGDNTFVDVINNSDDPWKNAGTEDSDFEGFKANFEENIITEQIHSDLLSNSNTNFNTVSQGHDLDDDFGDFDDFKSSEVEERGLDSHVSVLNIQSSDNENQVIESVNNVLYTIFELEIPNEGTLLEDTFNSLLSETWHHLKDVDVRQPYIVTWNNSMGQKTLLKALCIDSRNILFGPTWSYNMPKYATNLSAAPLQPQKQCTSTVMSQNEMMDSEKNINQKATESWTDPFAADGQDSCSPENSVTATEKTQKEFYIFDGSVKRDKIYSNTPSVQPLRQISLPDTHIFTPTDSETPRSKTIHYDSGPSVLLPNAVKEHDNNQVGKSDIPKKITENTNEFEYSDFEEFQSSNVSDTKPNIKAQAHENRPDPSTSRVPIVYQTQILQPIKVEPIIPTVNWPDPGEVKVTYEDFTDFKSNSSWNNDKQTADFQSKPANRIVDNLGQINNSIDNTSIQESSKDNTAFDDDFDTFQSAPVQRTTEHKFNHSHINTITNHSMIIAQNIPSQNLNTNHMSRKIDDGNVKSDAISFTYMPKTSETVKQNKPIINKEETILKPSEIIPKMSPVHSSSILTNNLLQPTPIAVQNQHKAGQILQPLSLESYSQINWPSPGIDLHDLSRFNPVESLKSLKSDLSVNAQSKVSSPVHNKKSSHNQPLDDDVWGDFVSSKPSHQTQPKKSPAFADDDEWSEFVSSPIVKPQNGLSTISLNVHTNFNMQKSSAHNQTALDIPTLNYVTPKSSNYKPYTDRHFQNL